MAWGLGGFTGEKPIWRYSVSASNAKEALVRSDNRQGEEKGLRERRMRRRLIALGAACALVCVFAFVWMSSPSPSAPLSQAGGAQAPDYPALWESPGQAQSEAGDPAQTPGQAEIETISNGEDGIAPEHEAGIVLVQLADGATAASLSQALATLDCVQHVDLSEDDIVMGYASLPVAEGVSVLDAMKQLQALSVVRDSQPNFVYHLADDWPGGSSAAESADALGAAGAASLVAGVVDEAQLAVQTTSVDDPRASEQWALESVGAYDAWDAVRAEKRVTVAVFDTGCNITHEDLKDNIVQAYDATGYNSIADSNGHGTHVCGIVAAEANNGLGVAGVSYNAQLLPVKVFVGSNASTTALQRAYQYLRENAAYYNVRVINVSLGLTVKSSEELASYDKDKALYNAVQTLRDENGVLTVCSAGNDASSQHGAYLNFPGDWLDIASSVIALRQTTGGGVTIADYSNYNMSGQKTKDLSAPGGYSSSSSSTRILSTTNSSDSSYGYLHGTSMAAPCVSGIAAMLFAANPSLTPSQVQDILHNSATDLGDAGWDEKYGYGEVNAARAVTEAYLGLFLDGDSSVLVGGSCTLAPSADGTWTWRTSDPAVATVSLGGVVRGVSGGQAVITATRSGDGKAVSRTVTVYDISFSGSHRVFVGEDTVLAFNEKPDTGMWLIGSSDESVATTSVAGDVTVTGVKEGTATITATLASNDKLKVTWEVNVLPARIDFSQAQVSMQGWTYDGEAHKPGVTVVLSGAVLPASTYTVVYANNVNAGTCSATVSPVDTLTYKNTAVGTCTVSPASLAGATMQLAEVLYVYDGTAKQPATTVTLGSVTLQAGSDYVVTYADNVKPGTATATVAGTGNYAGTLSATFTIEDVPQAMHRLYNPNSGEHFYTGDDSEWENVLAAGWTDEGWGWTAPAESDTPVYRLYNANGGEHHYTMSGSERARLIDLGWTDEGIGWYSDDARTVTLYREYNPNAFANNHNYTTSLDEHEWLVGLGWTDEGTAWYGV